MKRRNNYDAIAPFYDFLARMVIGKPIVQSQLSLLPCSDTPLQVLILGGGTGWMLRRFLDLNPHARVWYVETSRKMMSLSKKKNRRSNNVHFLHGTMDDLPLSIETFDLVITNFFLDQFSPAEVRDLAKKIGARLQPEGSWLVADFVSTSFIGHQILLKAMILFFRIFTHFELYKLTDWRSEISSAGFKSVREKRFHHGFIYSCEFRKFVKDI